VCVSQKKTLCAFIKIDFFLIKKKIDPKGNAFIEEPLSDHRACFDHYSGLDFMLDEIIFAFIVF
jgi:hypothetical protein